MAAPGEAAREGGGRAREEAVATALAVMAAAEAGRAARAHLGARAETVCLGAMVAKEARVAWVVAAAAGQAAVDGGRGCACRSRHSRCQSRCAGRCMREGRSERSETGVMHSV